MINIEIKRMSITKRLNTLIWLKYSLCKQHQFSESGIIVKDNAEK